MFCALHSALGSWLSLRFPNQVFRWATGAGAALVLTFLVYVCACTQELYFATVRDCYEAYVVYCFLALVLVYCGGDGICVAKMQEKVRKCGRPFAGSVITDCLVCCCQGSIRHPFPLCRLAPVSTDGLFLRRCVIKRADTAWMFS